MGFVNSVIFFDDNGNEIQSESEATKAELSFSCPVCKSHTITKEVSYPLYEYEKYICSNCNERDFLYPVVNKDGDEVDIENQPIEEVVETQLESLSIVFKPISSYPNETLEMSHTPDIAILAVLATFSGYLSLTGIALHSQTLLETDPTYAFVFFGGVLSLFIGLTSTYIGPVKSVYHGYKVYSRFNLDCTFTEFIYHSANYYHTEPL